MALTFKPSKAQWSTKPLDKKNSNGITNKTKYIYLTKWMIGKFKKNKKKRKSENTTHPMNK